MSSLTHKEVSSFEADSEKTIRHPLLCLATLYRRSHYGCACDTAALQQGVMEAHMAAEDTVAATAACTAVRWAQALVSVIPLSEVLLHLAAKLLIHMKLAL